MKQVVQISRFWLFQCKCTLSGARYKLYNNAFCHISLCIQIWPMLRCYRGMHVYTVMHVHLGIFQPSLNPGFQTNFTISPTRREFLHWYPTLNFTLESWVNARGVSGQLIWVIDINRSNYGCTKLPLSYDSPDIPWQISRIWICFHDCIPKWRSTLSTHRIARIHRNGIYPELTRREETLHYLLGKRIFLQFDSTGNICF